MQYFTPPNLTKINIQITTKKDEGKDDISNSIHF